MQLIILMSLAVSVAAYNSYQQVQDYHYLAGCQSDGTEICATNGYEYMLFENTCRLRKYNLKRLFSGQTDFVETSLRHCGKRCEDINCSSREAPVCATVVGSSNSKTFKNECEIRREICYTNQPWHVSYYGQCGKSYPLYSQIKSYAPEALETVCASLNNQRKTFRNMIDIFYEYLNTGNEWIFVSNGPCRETTNYGEEHLDSTHYSEQHRGHNFSNDASAGTYIENDNQHHKLTDDSYRYNNNQDYNSIKSDDNQYNSNADSYISNNNKYHQSTNAGTYTSNNHHSDRPSNADSYTSNNNQYHTATNADSYTSNNNQYDPPRNAEFYTSNSNQYHTATHADTYTTNNNHYDPPSNAGSYTSNSNQYHTATNVDSYTSNNSQYDPPNNAESYTSNSNQYHTATHADTYTSNNNQHHTAIKAGTNNSNNVQFDPSSNADSYTSNNNEYHPSKNLGTHTFHNNNYHATYSNVPQHEDSRQSLLQSYQQPIKTYFALSKSHSIPKLQPISYAKNAPAGYAPSQALAANNAPSVVSAYASENASESPLSHAVDYSRHRYSHTAKTRITTKAPYTRATKSFIVKSYTKNTMQHQKNKHKHYQKTTPKYQAVDSKTSNYKTPVQPKEAPKYYIKMYPTIHATTEVSTDASASSFSYTFSPSPTTESTTSSEEPLTSKTYPVKATAAASPEMIT